MAASDVYVVKFMDGISRNLFNINGDDLIVNIKLAGNGGMPLDDRRIRADMADLLLDNFAMLTATFFGDSEFREQFIGVINEEKKFNALNEAEQNILRKAMKSPSAALAPTKNYYTIDLTVFNKSVLNRIKRQIDNSYKTQPEFAEAISYYKKMSTRSLKNDIGYIYSNFMYLIRAFIKNEVFMNYVYEIITKMNKELERMRNMTQYEVGCTLSEIDSKIDEISETVTFETGRLTELEEEQLVANVYDYKIIVPKLGVYIKKGWLTTFEGEVVEDSSFAAIFKIDDDSYITLKEGDVISALQEYCADAKVRMGDVTTRKCIIQYKV